MEWLQQLPADNFTFGLLAGLVLGIASKWALKLVAYVVLALVVVELVQRMAYAL